MRRPTVGWCANWCARGHDVLFLERDMPWYAEHRDLPQPPYGETHFISSLDDLRTRFGGEVREADGVIVGSFVPEGVAVGEWVTNIAAGVSDVLRYRHAGDPGKAGGGRVRLPVARTDPALRALPFVHWRADPGDARKCSTARRWRGRYIAPLTRSCITRSRQ